MIISDFQRVLAAEIVSNFGSMLSRLVLPWLATLVLTATPFEMGLLLMADVVAGACGSLLLGAVVDRMRKRAVMLAADAARDTQRFHRDCERTVHRAGGDLHR